MGGIKAKIFKGMYGANGVRRTGGGGGGGEGRLKQKNLSSLEQTSADNYLL